jgi:hypothetical protein
MQHTSSDQLLEDGITLCLSGNKVAGFDSIAQAAQLNPYNERAWLWLGGLTTDRDERIFYLNQVLLINPQNPAALEGLRELGSIPQGGMPILPSILAPHKDSSAGKSTVRLKSPEPELELALDAGPVSASAQATVPDQSSALSQSSTRTTRVLAKIPHGADEPRLVSLIIDELSTGRRKNEVIQKVAENSWLNWEHSEELIDYVAAQHSRAIRSRYSWIFILLGSILLISVAMVVGYGWMTQQNFFDADTMQALAAVIPSWMYITTGVLLLFNTWVNLDIFMFLSKGAAISDLFGSFFSRIAYFVLGIGLIFLGFL